MLTYGFNWKIVNLVIGFYHYLNYLSIISFLYLTFRWSFYAGLR